MDWHRGPALTLHITLQDTKPKIWRRFVVPEVITLDRLHDVIQIVMGWQDQHLHRFEIDGKRFCESPEEPSDGEEKTRVPLTSVLPLSAKQFSYLYEYGDHWLHRLIVDSKRLPV